MPSARPVRAKYDPKKPGGGGYHSVEYSRRQVREGDLEARTRQAGEAMSDKTINDLRAALFDALQKVKDGTMDLDKARAVNELGRR